MREIKFRAWDKINKKMAEVYVLSLSIIQGHIICEDNKLFSGCDYTSVEIMQYTGLNDKNGKEVYEGDIIFNPNSFGCVCGNGIYTDEYPDKRIIIWNNKDLRFDFDFLDKNMRGEKCSGYCLCETNKELFEVIGNICENPDLIKGDL